MSEKLARRIFLLPVRGYKKFISPLLGSNCIYNPSCSTYMVEAVTKHGIVKGFILGLSRLLRCNRFYLGGDDPVPEKFSFKALREPYIIFSRRPRAHRKK